MPSLIQNINMWEGGNQVYTIEAMIVENQSLSANVWTPLYINPESVAEEDRGTHLAEYPKNSGKYVWRVPKAGHWYFDAQRIGLTASVTNGYAAWFWATDEDTLIELGTSHYHLNSSSSSILSIPPFMRPLNAGQRILLVAYVSSSVAMRSRNTNSENWYEFRIRMTYLGNDAGRY